LPPRDIFTTLFLIVCQSLMMRASILLTLPLFFCVSARAQKITTDAVADLNANAYHFYLNNPDTAILLSQQALTGALQLQNSFHEGYAYFVLAKSYWVKANYKLSTEYGFKALKLFRNTPHYQELGCTLLALARTLGELGNIAKANEFIAEASDLGRSHSDDWLQAAALRERSYLLTELNQLDSALYYSDKATASSATAEGSASPTSRWHRMSMRLATGPGPCAS
jgi:two-component system, sensor histidine kinase and response regulator